MKIINDIREIETDIRNGIATPYIKPSRLQDSELLEIGFCKVDGNRRVFIKLELKEIFNNFFYSTRETGHPLRMDSTSDGYIRFWTDSVDYYLDWDIDIKNKLYILKCIKR